MITEQFFTQLGKYQRAGVMATVINVSGSTPVKPGARLFADRGHLLFGTVGGGTAEQQVLCYCAEYDAGQHELQTKRLSGCGGQVEVCLETLDLTVDMVRSFWTYLADLISSHSPCLFFSCYDPDQKQIYYFAGDRSGPGSHYPENQQLLQSVSSQWPQLWENKKYSGFDIIQGEQRFAGKVQPFNNSPRLFIMGAGHVATELAFLSERTGFQTIVVDPRADLAVSERFSAECTVRCCSFSHFFQEEKISAQDFLVIMTPDHGTDLQVLKLAAATDAAYIGLLGSKKKIDSFCRVLKQEDLLDIVKDRLFAPIGIAIGSRTPPEVAVSIVAQLIKQRNQQSLNSVANAQIKYV